MEQRCSKSVYHIGELYYMGRYKLSRTCGSKGFCLYDTTLTLDGGLGKTLVEMLSYLDTHHHQTRYPAPFRNTVADVDNWRRTCQKPSLMF